MTRSIPLLKLLLAALAALVWTGPAAAEVELAFYSRELGVSFPHAFVKFEGTLAATGQEVDEAFGFTARTVSPAVLMGSVAGYVIGESDSYIRGSDRQFSLVLSDEEYHAARAVVEKWRTAAQPSYNLNRRNCIHFVAEIAEAVGLKVDYVKKLMKKPRSFLLNVKHENEQLLAARQMPVSAASAPLAAAH